MFDQKIEEMIEQVQKPARYTGGEMNTAIKSWPEAEVHFAFCFPDTYEVAMSHLGMKILYGVINQQPWALCERVCMPWVDMKALMEKEGVPLFSLETRTPLNRFDVVGFTLQYEMSYSNILAMLKLGGIPLHTAERTDADPIVCVGGPCAFNPEPLADFVDAVMIGDGEEMIVEFIAAVREWKKSGEPREACLRRLAKIPGVYVPSFYEVSYHEDGTIAAFTPKCPEAPATVRKRLVLDMDKAYYPTEIPVPYTEIVHDRIMLEIMRGCTRGCRFCEAGILYRPVRERSLERLMELARALEKSTGYEEISLSSLSSGDYSCLPELIRALMAEFREKRVSVSLPSLRIDSVLKDSLEETQQVKKSSLTFAPEAGTQRLRDVINKGVTEQDLVEKVTDAFQGGWSSVKLYFMIGLPTETYEDLDGIGHLAQVVNRAYFTVPKEKRARGLRVTCSASSFVPKPFTPFQWEPQDTQQQIKDKQAYLREVLRRIKGVNFNWHEPELSYLEACFSRGDRRLGKVLERAVEKGCILDGWSEQFRFDTWMEAFQECGLDPEWYAYRRREKDEILPWDFIDAGVTKAFLWREKERAERGEITPDCRKGCQGCGLRRFEGVVPGMRMLAVFCKGERLRHIGHLDLMRAMQRALRRSELPVSYSKGFNPHILLTFASALSTGAWGKREIMDVTLERDISPETFMEAMNAALPEDLRVLSARAIDDRHPALMAMVTAAEYTLTVMDENVAASLAACKDGFLSQEAIITPRKTKSGVKDCDVKPLILALSVTGNQIRAKLCLTESTSCKPDMLLNAWCAYAGCPVPRVLICRESLWGQDGAGRLQPLETL